MLHHKDLFAEYQLNSSIILKNKIVMAPMTRAKSDAHLIPTPHMTKYYASRAEAGLIITEGTVISSTARGHDFVPGIFTTEQVNAWRHITDAVHCNNGCIFSQLWHVGRVSHPYFLNGTLPISASSTTMSGKISRSNGLEFGNARAATTEEIKKIVQDYYDCALHAITAGFDGIEIHAANGYLLDQFLHHDTNSRDDEYGKSPENMARFTLQVVEACTEAIGKNRVSIRISPGAYMNGMTGDKHDADVFKYLLDKLSIMQIAYVHTGNFDHTVTFPELGELTMTQFIREHYRGTLIAAGSYDIESACRGVKEQQFDLVAFGRPFIANPDLITRIRLGQTLIKYDTKMLDTLI